jgi:hypothetical protein
VIEHFLVGFALCTGPLRRLLIASRAGEANAPSARRVHQILLPFTGTEISAARSTRPCVWPGPRTPP